MSKGNGKKGRFTRTIRSNKRAKLARMKSTADYKAYLKERGLCRCEVCGWFDPLLPPYFGVEIHHIRRHADGGRNAFLNYLAACPNHHAVADRLSTRDPNMSKQAIIAMILEHEHLSRRQREGA